LFYLVKEKRKKAVDTLKQYRSDIDAIDFQIKELFLKRMELVGFIANYKMEKDLSVYDASREMEVVLKNLENINHPEFKEYYKEVLETIMKVSKEYQKALIMRSTL